MKEETPKTVSAIMEGLGYKEVIVKGISNRTFIAYFPYESDLSGIDMDFLLIAFNRIQQVKWQELKLTRRTWVECRGLPMVAWKEGNFERMLSAVGKVFSYAPFLDEEGFYQTPKIQIETNEIFNICTEVKCEILGTLFNCGIVECGGSTFNYQEEQFGESDDGEEKFNGTQRASQGRNKEIPIEFGKTNSAEDSPKGPGSINSIESPIGVNSGMGVNLDCLSPLRFQTEKTRVRGELNIESMMLMMYQKIQNQALLLIQPYLEMSKK